MKFLRQLAQTELTALAALAIAAVVLAGFSAVQVSFAANSLLGVAGSAKVVFLYTMAFGCLPVALFGAPLYSTLRYFRKAGWLTAMGIGLLPGLALLLVATDLALWSLLCGVFVALVTHAICGRGSNNSFKADGFAAA
jgi:hypothetical protein